MSARAGLALAAMLSTAACGTPLMKLPAGPGVPAVDAAAAFAQASAACRGVRTISAEVAVSGVLAGRRVRGRLLVGLASPDSAYLEAPAPFGAPAFTLAARGAQATLVLPRDRRVLESGDADAVLEAVTGLPLSPSDLRSTLTGCTDAMAPDEARTLPGGWLRVTGAADVYLRRERAADSWRIVAVVRRPGTGPEWRAEYRDFLGDLPRTLRLTSADGRRFDLQVSLSQVDINVPLDVATFRPRVPAGMTPITLDELRSGGPLTAPPANER